MARATSFHFVAGSVLALSLAACGSDDGPAQCVVNCAGADSAVPAVDAGLDATQIGSVATSDAGKNDASVASPPLPCAVKKIIEDKCQLCHSDPPNYSAYMALTNHSQFHLPGTTDKTKPYYQLAQSRINAPASGALAHMPPLTSPQLSAAELATLNAWLDQQAPAGDGSACGSAGGGDAGAEAGDGAVGRDAGDAATVTGTTGLDCYKLLARGSDLKSPYKVGVASDAYFNFVFAAPWQGTAYGIVIRPVIDNTKVIHHWLLFQDQKTGTPSGATAGSGAHPGGQLLHGWAPGAEAIDFRETGADVGIELPQTTYTVEIHYNSTDANALDASGVEICTAKTKPANIAALSWLGHDNTLLAGDLGGARAAWTGTCTPTSKEPIHILSVWPHMHLEGRQMKGTINRANGTKEVLHDAPFDFNYQRLYKKYVTLMPGDSIVTDCSFAKPMSFGEATTDEMCYLFTMAYPKGALADNGSWGKSSHGGSACLGQ
jgi:hypothetical protein